MSEQIRIEGRAISKTEAPYVIAEVSANHNGSIQRALKTIEAASDSGADAVKIQTYSADTMTIDSKKSDFMVREGLWKGRTLHDLYSEAQTPFDWHEEMFNFAKEKAIVLFSSPFDESAVDLLEKLGAPAYKIASFEIVDLPLISYVASTGKPMLISTGMADKSEIAEAVSTARDSGCKEIALFHCISGYPTPIEETKLSMIEQLRTEFGVPVGFSDHTSGNVASTLAVAAGASMIEKHFTLSRADGGVDSSFSAEPEELRQLIQSAGAAALALGIPDYSRTDAELDSRIFRRSLYFVRDLEKGHLLTPSDIRRIRPGYGLKPKFLDDVIGSRLTRSVEAGDRVEFESIGL